MNNDTRNDTRNDYEAIADCIHKLTGLLIAAERRPDPQPTRDRLYVYYTIGSDRNRNKLVRAKSDRGGFSIQTNGNLPRTHRDGVTSATDAEVCAYVRRYGTARQKRILDI